MKKTKKRAKARTSAVCSGQVYRVPRRGKPARHVRISAVRGLASGQPVASYVEVTRTGNPKPGRAIKRFLTWKDGGWAIGPGFDLAEI